MSVTQQTSMPAAASGEVVIIITPDHLAVMDPPVPLLEPVLQNRHRRFLSGGPTGYRQVSESRSLCTFDYKGRLVFSAGLVQRVHSLLRDHGYSVRVEDRRKHDSQLLVEPAVLGDVEPSDKALLEAIVREPLGQIETQSFEDAVARCMLLGRAFPRVRFVVGMPTRRQAWKMWHELEGALNERVGLVMAGVRRQGERWLVGTFAGVEKSNPGKRDVLLLPCGEEAAADTAACTVAGKGFARIYAFVRPQRRPDRLLRLRLEQMAGPVIRRLARPRVSVRVVMLPTPACAIATSSTALERKRTLYWHNEARNERVAAVARVVVKADPLMLKAVGLRNQDVRMLRNMDTSRVVVLVETPEHGRRLLPLLPPGWRMLDAEAVEDKHTTFQGPAVVTAVYASRRRIRANVVIRATGTEWPVRLKGFPPRQGTAGGGDVLLIDFDDRFDAHAAEDSRCRVAEYRRCGRTVTVRRPDSG